MGGKQPARASDQVELQAMASRTTRHGSKEPTMRGNALMPTTCAGGMWVSL
jgi:hypothetical protein